MKCLIFLIMLFVSYSTLAQSTFKIVFVSNLSSAIDSQWLGKIASDWAATGICLRVVWGDLDDNSTPGVDSWTELDAAIRAILNYKPKELDIYIRVSMGFNKPPWAHSPGTYLNDDDFQIVYDGSLYDSGQGSERKHPLNFSSTVSQSYMEQFFNDVLDHINNYYSTYKNRFIEVVPSWSTNEESEYPGGAMCGYSSYEIAAFIGYLQNQYESLTSLNEKWASSFTNWTQINPKDYSWQLNDNPSYMFPNGRVDWMSFRTKQLADFISDLSIISNSKGFEYGVQLGSIYDAAIERRGWYDPTQLIEHVNAVHVADIGRYHNNFEFAADYLRSLAEFWTIKNVMQFNPIRFTTETNWPYYYPLETDKWDEQLVAYFNKGAQEHYVFGWSGYTPSQLDYFKTTLYPDFYNSIINHVGQPLTTINNQYAIHMGCEQVLFNHNPQVPDEWGTFELYNSIVAQSPYAANISTNYDGNKDIITNYMIEKYPTYLNNYTAIYFTKASEYITVNSYLSLMKSAVTIPFVNATHYFDSGHGEYAYTHGIKNEYNEIRSPVHLIWRSRTDLQNIWQDANLPAPGSGHSEDIISWAHNYGCGYIGTNKREYPLWEVRDDGLSGNYNYDNNIRSAWNSRNDLITAFPNAHNYDPNITTLPNMISWSKQYGYFEESEFLQNYNNWPYIGDVGISESSFKNVAENENELPQEFHINNFPNPFNPTTKIKFTIIEKGFVTLKVYDVLGKEIKTLVKQPMENGIYTMQFDGSELPSGTYFYILRVNDLIRSNKMILLK